MTDLQLYRTLVVEDDPGLSANFLSLLSEFPCFQVVGSANSVSQAAELITFHKPDLVFLDIELGNANAFELLLQFPEPDFEIVFTTAHEKYALEAVKLSAMDYLLKPFGKEDLKNVIRKLHRRRTAPQSLQVLMNNYHTQSLTERTIGLKSVNDIRFVKVKDILSLSSEGSYTQFKLKDQQEVLVSENLKKYEGLLTVPYFFRIHHSHLINMEEVIRYVKTDGGSVELSDGSVYPISRRRKESFCELLKSLSI